MIPSDLATRLRAFIETTVQPLAAVADIPSDLPSYEPGQRFTAQIQNPLPDGTFRALVAGKTVTLALPDAAKSGDVLELVVTGHEGNTLNARIADVPDTSSAQAKPQLSQAGQLISQLLTGRFGENEPVSLQKGQPLLPAPPQTGAQIAPALQQAVRESGLFFESHQASWVAGGLPLDQLLAEPQAQAASPTQATKPDTAGHAPHSAMEAKPQLQPNLATTVADKNIATLPRLEHQSAALAAAIEKTQIPTDKTQLQIPDSLMPLVHQQLETLASHQAVWQGQVWPGQQMRWTVIDPDEQGGAHSEEETRPWTSEISLTLPRLGSVAARLVLTPAGLALRLDTDQFETASRLNAAVPQLADALAAAGVPLTGFAVSAHASA